MFLMVPNEIMRKKVHSFLASLIFLQSVIQSQVFLNFDEKIHCRLVQQNTKFIMSIGQ